MQAEFWHERWQLQQTGFHLDEVNDCLVKHAPAVFNAEDTIFVPLCGKSHDLIYLAQHHAEVIGIELSKLAVEQFWEEHGLSPEWRKIGDLDVSQHQNLTLICGDIFAMQVGDWPCFSAVYDRASLVALPAPMRIDYLKKLNHLAQANYRTLLITLTHPRLDEQGDGAGPPFSIPPEMVERLHQEKEVVLLQQYDFPSDDPFDVGYIFRLQA